MDKLSLYEILSFVVPGFVAYKIVESIHVCFFNGNQFLESDNIGDSLLLFCLALFIGVCVHFITMNIFLNYKWYKKLLYESPSLIVMKTSKIIKITPFLNEEYFKIKKHKEEIEISDEKIIAEGLFSFAYYYLEVNDKITQSKNFQSFYFAFRNICTLFILFVPIYFILLIFGYINNYCLYKINLLNNFLLLFSIITFISVFIARWLRKKMIERVLWSYYIERVHKKNENK